LQHGILPAEGVDALARIVGAGFPQVIASTQDLPLMLDLDRLAGPSSRTSAGPTRSPVAHQAGPIENGSRHARPALANPYVAPRDEEEREIAQIWSTLLGIEGVGVHDNFFDLGGHSLLATRVLARLQDSVGIALPLETVLDAPTVAQMAERIGTLRWMTAAGRPAGVERTDREEFEL
jgi:acyl carrier protein